jgi:hypothetical protein
MTAPMAMAMIKRIMALLPSGCWKLVSNFGRFTGE